MSRKFTGGTLNGSAYALTVQQMNDRRLGLGIDFGGTGIKAALLDLESGGLVTRRIRISTPQPATPEAVASTIAELTERIDAEHAIPADAVVGCGLPAPIKEGRVMAAANIDSGWVGVSVDEVLGTALGRPVVGINDADAAGLAEMRFGAGRGHQGTVLLLTIGTGIGSGLFVDGRLVPNTEMGHLEYRGKDAEVRLSGVARQRRKLSWKAWAVEFNEFLARVDFYFWPDLIILGGGVSKVVHKYVEYIDCRAPVVAATFRNTSGIIGAAVHAGEVRAEGSAV
jgi:polyphosphate glucokinase